MQLRSASPPSSLPPNDPDGFEDLYRREYVKVVKVAYVFAGNWSLAEDAAQEAFVRAMMRWREVSRMDSPEGWLRTVAINVARSKFRRLGAEARALFRLTRRLEDGTPAGASRLEARIDEYGELWAAIRRLPARQAQAVVLHYFEDLSVREVANLMRCAEGTVKALLHQSRQRLGRELGVGVDA